MFLETWASAVGITDDRLSLFASCPEHRSFLCTGAASLSALVVSSDWPLGRLISLYCISNIEPFSFSKINRSFEHIYGLPWWLAYQYRRPGFDLWVGKIPLEKEMTNHSGILAWEIPWTEEPGGLQSMWS